VASVITGPYVEGDAEAQFALAGFCCQKDFILPPDWNTAVGPRRYGSRCPGRTGESLVPPHTRRSVSLSSPPRRMPFKSIHKGS